MLWLAGFMGIPQKSTTGALRPAMGLGYCLFINCVH